MEHCRHAKIHTHIQQATTKINDTLFSTYAVTSALHTHTRYLRRLLRFYIVPTRFQQLIAAMQTQAALSIAMELRKQVRVFMMGPQGDTPASQAAVRNAREGRWPLDPPLVAKLRFFEELSLVCQACSCLMLSRNNRERNNYTNFVLFIHL